MASKYATLPAAQQDVLRRLVADGTLTVEQADKVRAGFEASAAPAPWARGWLVEAAGYVGGALMFGGATLLVGVSWDELSRLGRFLVLAVATVLLAGAGTASAGGPRALPALADAPSTVRRRITSVLFALAAGTGALAAGVTIADRGVLVGAATGLVLAALAYLVVPSLPVLAAAAGLSVITAIALVDDLAGTTPLRVSLAMIVVAALWAGLGLSGVVPHRSGALVVAAVVALIGAQQTVGEPDTAAWAYGLTLLVALACLAGYAFWRNLVLLVAGVVGVTIAAMEAVADWTNGAVGGAGLVIAAGAVLLAASGIALRRHRRSA